MSATDTLTCPVCGSDDLFLSQVEVRYNHDAINAFIPPGVEVPASPHLSPVHNYCGECHHQWPEGSLIDQET